MLVLNSVLGTGGGMRFPPEVSPVMEGVPLSILVGDLTLVKAEGWCPPVIRVLTRAGGRECTGE